MIVSAKGDETYSHSGWKLWRANTKFQTFGVTLFPRCDVGQIMPGGKH